MWDNDWDCNGADRDPDPPEEQRERDIYDYIDDDREMFGETRQASHVRVRRVMAYLEAYAVAHGLAAETEGSDGGATADIG